jgi:phosphoribosylaminoimidazole-succinocarboxamide synthase
MMHDYMSPMIKTRLNKLISGTTKTVFEGTDSNTLILGFNDEQRLRSGLVQKTLMGKGIINNRISAHLMTCLESIGLPTHFLRSLNMREQEIRNLDPMPIVFRVRNVASGSLVNRLGIDEGTVLPRPIIEFYHKKKAGDYALVTEDHIMAFQWADPYEMEEMMTIAYRSNDYLNGLFTGLGLRLVDFQMELGRLWGEYGELYVFIMDELSPDSMRLWDIKTNKPFDNTIESYQEVAARLGIIPREGLVKGGDFNEKLAENLEKIENILANDETRKIRSINKVPSRKGSGR